MDALTNKERTDYMKNEEMIKKLEELRMDAMNDAMDMFSEYLGLEPDVDHDRKLINMFNQKRHVIQLCEELISELYE